MSACFRPGAEKISLEMRCDPATSPAELTVKQLVAMHDLLHQLRFENPDGAHLSPVGEWQDMRQPWMVWAAHTLLFCCVCRPTEASWVA